MTTDNVTSVSPPHPPPSASPTPPLSFGQCSEWREAQDLLYQIASLLFAVAFLIPDDFRFHVTVMRAAVCVGCACLVVWGGVTLCQVDVLVWYLVFLSVNVFHLVYGVADCWPTALRPEVRGVYARLFAPLRVTRSEFKELTEVGCFKELPSGELYASQGETVIGDRLSLLLAGRLKVTRGWLFLHSVTANQFIDSPEYHESCIVAQSDIQRGLPSNAKFQVSVTAIESSRILTWNIQELNRFLDHRPFLRAVLNGLLGRDVARKIAQVHELFLANPQYTCIVSQNPSTGNARVTDGRSHRTTTCRVEPGAGGEAEGTRAGSGWGDGPRANTGVREGAAVDRTTPVRPQVINLQEKTRPAAAASSSSSSTSSNGRIASRKGASGVNSKLSLQKAETPIGPYSPSQVSYETFV